MMTPTAVLGDDAQKMLDMWKNGKVNKNEKLINVSTNSAEAQRHRAEMDLIKFAAHPKDDVPSAYTVDDNGDIDLSLPMDVPKWHYNAEMGLAKNHQRLTKIQRRLQHKLLARGVAKDKLAGIKSF